MDGGGASRVSLTKAVELARSFSHLLQSFFKSIWLFTIRAK